MVSGLLLMLSLVACGETDSTPAVTPTPKGPIAIVKITGSGVGMEGEFRFDPSDLTIKVGTTVEWLNESTATHTVDSTGGPDTWDSQPFTTGQSYSFTFTRPGFYTYRCGIHRAMKGTITVNP